MSFLSKFKFAVILLAAGYFSFQSCSGGSSDTVTEEVAYPTEGMITTVKEVETDIFKIEDEEVAPTPADSRIIAKYMDNTVDTFTLEQAKLYAAQDPNSASGRRYGGLVRAASYGLMGYMMGRSMSSHRPRANAYVDQKTYNKTSAGAGQRINQTAKRTTVTRPKSGRSGYGGGKSTRSYGG